MLPERKLHTAISSILLDVGSWISANGIGHLQEIKMKKLWIAAAALLIGLSFATPAAWAGRTAVIEQVGDGKLTVMMQSKRHFIGVTYNNPSQQKLDSVVPLMTHKKNTGLGRAKGGRCGAGAQHSGHGVNNATV